MKLERITADSWINAFSIMLFMNAAGALISGVIYVILGALLPMGSQEAAVTKFVSLGLGVAGIILAPLLYLWARALWQRRPWSRSLGLVAAWLAAVFAVLLIFGGVFLLMDTTDAARSHLVGIILILLAVILAAYAGFLIWLLNQEDIIALFGAPQRLKGMELRAAVVRAWALIIWVSAAAMALAGALVILASPVLAGYVSRLALDGASALGGWAIMAAIALFLLLGAGLMHLVSKGLWSFRNWARIVLIIFACLSIVFTVASFAVGVKGFDATQMADSASNLLYSTLLSGVQLWFLFTSKELFVHDADDGAAVKKPKAVPKNAVPSAARARKRK